MDTTSKLGILGKKPNVVYTTSGKLQLAEDEQGSIDYVGNVLLEASNDSIEIFPTDNDKQMKTTVDKCVEAVEELDNEVKTTIEVPVHPEEDIFTVDDLKHNDVSVGFFPFERKLDEDRYWKKSLFLDDEKYANKALRKHLLPDQQMLNDLAKHFGRKSELISKICKLVCVHIAEQDESIYDVWPAVKINCNDIVFVIMVKANQSNNKSQKSRLKEIRYSYVKRSLGEVSYEGQYVNNSRQFNKYSAELSSSEKELLQRGINNNNVQLMKRHKYLMMISGSPVRSKGHDWECHTIEREICIALYVLVKGYIPINEEPFDTEYEGLSVDVREGFFQLFTGPVNRFDNIKHGCQIITHQFGTVGGFVDYFGYGTCGLTCAHVVLDPTGMNSLASKEKDDMALGISLTDQIVYQPDKSLESNAIGNVVKAIYREGGNGESGIDLAVFHILQRYPMFGDFPDLEDGSSANVSYDSGKVADILRLGSCKVFKYGAATYLTSGEVVLDSSTLSVRTYETFEVNNDYNIKLHNLLEIRPDASFPEFAKEGDSGALVYCVGENNEPICVGVVEGGTGNNSCVVIPILPILEQLNLTSLKSFPNSITERKMMQMGQSLAEQFTQILRSACSLLETRISKTDARITSSECAMEIKLNQIEQNLRSVIEQERAKTVAEINQLLQGFVLQTQPIQKLNEPQTS